MPCATAASGLSELRGLPVHAVGEATAEAAREAGFDIASDRRRRASSGCSARSSPDLRLLHLCGEDRHEPAAARQAITPVTVYRVAGDRRRRDLRDVDGQRRR